MMLLGNIPPRIMSTVVYFAVLARDECLVCFFSVYKNNTDYKIVALYSAAFLA